MKVAFIIRSTLYSVPGGDTVQAVQTAKHLGALGIQVAIRLSSEPIDYSQYDLLHFFNLGRPADMLYHSRQSGKPFVVSTILCNYSEYDQFHRKGAAVWMRYCSPDTIEYLKTLARCVLGGDRLASLSYLIRGQRSSILRILQKAAVILPNSESEYRRLTGHYPCQTRYRVVTNGVNPELFNRDITVPRDETLVLCVARIEGIKNQLNLIRALNGTRFQLVLIGAHAPNQAAYYRECRALAAANIQFTGHIRQEELVNYYQRARVHILPSWFETTGLSSLEAAVMGCNVVITDKGDAGEYFGKEVFYCDPASPASILESVSRAASAPFQPSLRERILKRHTWKQAAVETLQAYELALTT